MNGGTIVHSIPGRTRLQILKGLAQEKVEASYRLIPGIHSAIYTKESGSVVLHHDLDLNSKKIVYGRTAAPSQMKNKPYKNEFTASGLAFLLDFLIPTTRFTGLMKLISPASLASLFACKSMIVNGLRPVTEWKRPNADTLSTTAIFASILKGNPKSAIVILFMSALSEIITDITAHRTKNYVKDMMNVDTQYVWKVDGQGDERKVSIDEVSIGDHIAVFEGEKVSADGKVISGWANVDQSSITGEYMPQHISRGQTVYAGTIVQSGNIRIEVSQLGDETAVARILQMIEEAQESKAPIQSYADEMSERLVPVSFLLALLTFAVTRSWDRVLNMLVIDYVCGIKLATATAISASIGKAARNGALIKGGEYLQKLSSIDTAVLDKTGTITEGKPEIVKIAPYNGFTEQEILMYAASAEEHSSHPIAEAILRKASDLNLTPYEHDHDSIENIVGHGVKALVNDKEVVIGNQTLLVKHEVDTNSLTFLNKSIKEKSTIFVAIDKKMAGAIVIEDALREGMKRTVNQLRRAGVDEIVMLTGDKREVAEEVYQELRLDQFHSEVLPHEKAAFVKQYKSRGSHVLMVGDGINDAPALALADVGVSMGGKRTDIAVEASDLVVTSDNPLILSDIIQLSKSTMAMIRQNFVITIAVNSAAILFGLFGSITPTIGAAIHNSATIAVVLNSTRLLVNKERISCKEPSPSSMTYLVDSA
ncbi:heavy metal translocating P-type ATPase [Halobacillus sp. A5]|uniref:heavy metal translocating P-type ATPase n=1 Tax=Halobacillus sp. A5 TaxID=2880263 RepID=UPI0020A67068|nr:heavy metal translocating P-type ATPase [Halobacillus sp. A5]